jgi:type II secretion system protein H
MPQATASRLVAPWPPAAGPGVRSGATVGRRSNPGFTLIELMVVITIIGIMTALMIPEMKGTFQDALLRSSSRELINVFDLAYSRAVSLNQVRRVRVDEKTGRYLVEKQVVTNGQEQFVPVDDVPGGQGQLDARIAVEYHPGGEPATGENPPAAEPPASGNPESTTPSEPIVVFYPDGTADAASFLLRDPAGFRLLLQISPITARVHVVEMEREGHS